MRKKGKETDFQSILVEWYNEVARPLPWRNTKDPYKIWLSEIILQQTRVDQGMPYYLKFVEKYPTVAHLALAPEDEVLRLWQGLGYYSRARNLHFTAKYIHEELNGIFPKTANELEELKGIGKYTAAAIASFAYHEQVAVCDGNVQRVLSRVFGLYEDISTSKGLKNIQQKAQELIPASHSAIYNQAIMEFGALYCTPKNMQCDSCVMNHICFAFAKKEQANLPVKTKKIKQRKRYFNYLVLEYEGKIWMASRGPKDIWQGLYQFYLKETASSQEKELEDNNILKNASLYSVSPELKHVLSHQIIYAKFWHYKLKKIPQGLNADQFYDKQDVEDLPKPILIVNYLKGVKF